MKSDKIILLFCLFGLFIECHGQDNGYSLGFWHHRSLTGQINLKGLYREQRSLFNDIEENRKSAYFQGGFLLNSNSYLWHPDILSININGEFNPETRSERYLIIPDRAEVRTLKKLEIRTSIFNNKSVTLNTYLNLNQNYFNREYLTNVRSNNQQWGGVFSLNNKILPASLTYRNFKWDQKETETGRLFRMNQENFQGRIGKSFGTRDKHELIYSYDDYSYIYDDIDKTANLVNRLALTNSIYFDADKNYSLSSHSSFYDQDGNYSFRKIDVNERINLRFTENFRLYGNYNYYWLENNFQVVNQNRITGSIEHKLYKSLYSSLFIEYSGVGHTLYEERNLKTGGELRYTKEIGSGQLNISYRYYRHHNNMDSEPASLQIINEEQVLSDAEITILNKPYIDINSLVVKDITGTIIYQPIFDYIATEQNSFLEIQRVPGGQIVDNQTVYIDYVAIQPGAYSYEANNNSISAGILLFKRLIEVYYRGSFQYYPRVVEAEYLTLNRYSQNIYGARLDLGFATTGIEYDNYNSNIIPYRSLRLYVNMTWSIRAKLIFSVNGNLRNYSLLGEEINQKYSNLSGRVAYSINSRTKANIEIGYLAQNGPNIDLELITTRAEISTSLRQLYIKAGIEMYRRHYLNSDITFNGTYIQFIRKF